MRLCIPALIGIAAFLGGCEIFGPVADFRASVTEGDLPLEVAFEDLSVNAGELITSWRWDFGDGTTSTARNPVHTYNERGVYNITLTVSSPRGMSERVRSGYINVRQVVRFPDTRLDAAIRAALNIPLSNIRVGDLETLSVFDATGAGVRNVAGLEFASNLQTLVLESNDIADITPLGALTGLRELNLRDNQLAELAPLATLTGLELLDAGVNNVTDLRPLAGLRKLEFLNLEQNPQLTDIRSLRHLTALRELSLAFTGITQNDVIDGAGNGDGLTAIADLVNLVFLDLAATDIHDLHSLAGLINLEELVLFECLIEDIAPLANLAQLRNLQLSANQIVVVEALAGLDKLDVLTLQMNQIRSIAPLVRNGGLNDNDVLRLTGNPLDTLSLCSAIPTLELRGVLVEVDQTCNGG